MRLLAVSSPVDIEIDGRKPPTIKDEGIDLELTNWRVITAPPGLSDGERERITGWVTQVLKSPQWQENVERYDWTPFVKTGAELDDFVATEQKRVQQVVADLGLGEVIGARAIGGVLLALGVVAFVADVRRRRRLVGERAAARAGRRPRSLLIALSLLFLVRPGDGPGRPLRGGRRGHALADAGAAARPADRLRAAAERARLRAGDDDLLLAGGVAARVREAGARR